MPEVLLNDDVEYCRTFMRLTGLGEDDFDHFTDACQRYALPGDEVLATVLGMQTGKAFKALSADLQIEKAAQAVTCELVNRDLKECLGSTNTLSFGDVRSDGFDLRATDPAAESQLVDLWFNREEEIQTLHPRTKAVLAALGIEVENAKKESREKSGRTL